MVTATSGPRRVAPLVGEVMVTCGCGWASAAEASANGRTNPIRANKRNRERLISQAMRRSYVGTVLTPYGNCGRLESNAMPFELEDLERIRVRVGMGTK